MFRFVFYLFVLAATVSATILKYDNNYKLGTNFPLTSYACSDGSNGLITKYGVSTVSQLQAKLKPNVYIAASPAIGGWNSANCGKCYAARNPKNNRRFFYIAVDVASPALVSGPDAFQLVDNLNAGQTTVYVSEQPLSTCFR